MKMDREAIKEAMLARMEEIGMNVATLARAAGLSYDTPRDFLVRDKSGMPAADKLVAMLSALDLQHLLTGAAAEPARNGLRAMRQRRGYGVEELAARLPRVTPAQIRKLEAGGKLSTAWKEKLARALECHEGELDAPAAAWSHGRGDASFHEGAPRAWKGQAPSGGMASFTDGSGWVAQHAAFLPGVPHEFLGKTCVVKLDDARTLLRRVMPGQSPGHYLLEPVHPGGRAIKEAMVMGSALVISLRQSR